MHWKPAATRLQTQLLVQHIAKAWKMPLLVGDVDLDELAEGVKDSDRMYLSSPIGLQFCDASKNSRATRGTATNA